MKEILLSIFPKTLVVLLLNFLNANQINNSSSVPSTYDSTVVRFHDEDTYAASIHVNRKSSIEDLVTTLVKPAKNDIEKARIIFTWIAINISYDDNGFNTGKYNDCTAETVFSTRKAVCQGYSALFVRMGKLAGLDIVMVEGYGKGIGYRNGNTFPQANHAWNAINIDGRWRLFDVTWASGYGKGVNGRLVTVKRFNDFWFDVDPDAFIFSHLPEDSKWQFNDGRITRQQFEKLPYPEDGYFEMGFDGGKCFREVLNGSFTEFPMAYGVDMLIHVNSMPNQKRLVSGKTYNISIKSVKACDIVIFNNKQLTHLTKNGNEFTTIIQPHHGKLSVDVKTVPSSRNYSTMLEYIVD
jgi:hypothetical protein